MPKSVNQKQKLLFLLDYLRQNTDETNTVTTPQIIDHLAANGIRAERKSIYNDIQTLCDYGYDIIRTEGAHAGYRIADRTFELPEVKQLVDLVTSSNFINPTDPFKLHLLECKKRNAGTQRRQFLSGQPLASYLG